jgi:hypothetical protein
MVGENTMSALRRSPRLAALLVAIAASGVAVALVVVGTGGSGSVDSSSETRDLDGMSEDARFAALSAERSNRCDLRAGDVRQMPGEAHLQGSCCFPMDRHRYAEQRRGLRHYRDIEQIPADPYDVPVALAKRLLAYRDIPLTQEQQHAYRQAMQKSELGGPCCCRCWRWQAFRGQANYLIARRDFSAAQVARVWDLEEGCGGTHEHA